MVRFESSEHLELEEKAIKTFVHSFSGSYKKLGINDIDFKVFNKDGVLIAYAEVKGRNRNYYEAFPLPLSARKIVKLQDKKLNPVVIWACYDGIVYSKLHELSGEIREGGRRKRVGSFNDKEMMAYFSNKENFKYIPYLETN